MDRRGFIKFIGIIAAGYTLEPTDRFIRRLYASSQGTNNWVMLIDLNVCMKTPTCRDCIDACVAAHNIPEIVSRKEEVKWIWKTRYGDVFHDSALESTNKYLLSVSIPVLCNHCENPPCVKVCPTKATWKRNDGIVMMDYHRCIGCRYCMAACPYGARSFNWRDPKPHIKKINHSYPSRTKGVVEKCNFCEERIAVKKPPACVEACKNKGMFFLDIGTGGIDPVFASFGNRHIMGRKTHLGTKPKVYYVI